MRLDSIIITLLLLNEFSAGNQLI